MRPMKKPSLLTGSGVPAGEASTGWMVAPILLESSSPQLNAQPANPFSNLERNRTMARAV